jgi:16S rRNA (cytosine1402-N4)-methyltransferase
MSDFIHSSIMVSEIADYILQGPGSGEGTLVDATLGEGGHSEAMLSRFPGLSVIGMERDPEILTIARKRLEPFGERFTGVQSNFANLSKWLDRLKVEPHYVLYDFGISSYHFDMSGRGFAFAKDEKLDMRLDGDGISAYDIINSYSDSELADIFYFYGEERMSRRIARRIVAAREESPIVTTGDLAAVVLKAIPRNKQVKNIHPATRVFQALRIEVNGELTAIETALDDLPDITPSGCRIMAMSFHSLEDRIVKDRFRRWSKGCRCQLDPRDCQCTYDPMVSLVTKKPVIPGEEEVKENNRARSAKLRVCDRV